MYVNLPVTILDESHRSVPSPSSSVKMVLMSLILSEVSSLREICQNFLCVTNGLLITPSCVKLFLRFLMSRYNTRQDTLSPDGVYEHIQRSYNR